MRKLYRAECSRMFRSRLFVILCAVVILSAGVISFFCAQDAKASVELGDVVVTEDFFYNLFPYSGVICAAFITLFLGDEFSNGTVRNKLIAGYGRTELYLGYFAVCFSGCMILTGLWLLGSMVGKISFGPFSYGLAANLKMITAIVACIFLWCAMYCLLAVGGGSRAVKVVLAFALWFAMILCGSGLLDRLACEEMRGGYAYINGAFVEMPLEPNPLYIGGTLRIVLGTIAHAFPGSLSILINDFSLDKPLQAAALATANALFLLMLGALRFRKEDLK